MNGGCEGASVRTGGVEKIYESLYPFSVV